MFSSQESGTSQDVSGLQPLMQSLVLDLTHGVAMGWYVSGRWP
jgi:hypothetical protein